MLDARRAILRDVAEAQNDDPVEQFRVGFARILEEGEPPWELIADDFVWDMSGVPWAEQDEYVGHAGFTKFWREWTEAWEDWRLEPVEFIPIGEQMVIVSHQTGRAKASGVPVEMTHAQIWSGADGMVTRARMFESREDAIATAEAEARAAEAAAEAAAPTSDGAP